MRNSDTPNPSRKSANKARKRHVTKSFSPEIDLIARLARELGLPYDDDFPEGLQVMSQYVGALFRFIEDGGNDNDSLLQLYTQRIVVKISTGVEGDIECDRNNGTCKVILPRIPGQTPAQEVERIESMLLRLQRDLPFAQLRYFVGLIRALPPPARKKLLKDYGQNKTRRKKNPHRG